jgi:hypothetical protein
MGMNWSAPTDPSAVARRAGGRRRYNALRKLNRDCRRAQVYELLRRFGDVHGTQARIVKELGSTKASISRDVRAVRAWAAPCGTCGHRPPIVGPVVPQSRKAGPALFGQDPAPQDATVSPT